MIVMLGNGQVRTERFVQTDVGKGNPRQKKDMRLEYVLALLSLSH
jgi:hypothetical protein